MKTLRTSKYVTGTPKELHFPARYVFGSNNEYEIIIATRSNFDVGPGRWYTEITHPKATRNPAETVSGTVCTTHFQIREHSWSRVTAGMWRLLHWFRIHQ